MQELEKAAIKEIMEAFDFNRVYKTMKRLKWKWGDKKVSIQELKHTAQSMLEYVVRYQHCGLGSGGFSVQYENGILTLRFILEEWYEITDEKKYNKHHQQIVAKLPDESWVSWEARRKGRMV